MGAIEGQCEEQGRVEEQQRPSKWSVRDGGERTVQNLSRCRRRIGRCFALLAIQTGTQMLVASSDGKHPGAIREWRLMPHVLSMTTGQLGNPIAIVILVISDDGLLHVVMILVLQEGAGLENYDQVTDIVSSAILLDPSQRQRFSNGSSGR
jgi:hypothetical protein